MIDLPQLREGQTLRVFQKVTEGKRERNVQFTGRVLKVRGAGMNQMITVRQNLEGIDVDKIFPTALPTLTKVEIIEQARSLTKGPAVGKKKSKRSSASKKSKKKKK